MRDHIADAAAPRVSVVVPSYNHAAFLRECLDSVLSQGWPNLELIVVDDGSSDGSLDILRDYAGRITLLQQRGGRQARARNLALGVATGEFIAFLDSDDRFRPERLASALDAFAARPGTDLVWGDFRCIDEAGAVIDEVNWNAGAQTDFRLSLIAGNPICNASVTVRRGALDSIGGFDERLPRSCDGHAWLRMAARGMRFVHCGRSVVDYRMHRGNDSARFATMSLERDEALRDAVREYRARGVIVGADSLRWLRRALLRQLAFRAAADVDAELPGGPLAALRRRALRALGSATGQRFFAAWRGAKATLIPRSRP